MTNQQNLANPNHVNTNLARHCIVGISDMWAKSKSRSENPTAGILRLWQNRLAGDSHCCSDSRVGQRAQEELSTVTGGGIVKAGGNEFPEFGFESSKIMICIKKYAWQSTRKQMVTFKQIWIQKAHFSHGCKQLGADQSWMNRFVIPKETVCNPNAWGLNEQWEVRRSENEALDLPSSTAVVEPRLFTIMMEFNDQPNAKGLNGQFSEQKMKLGISHPVASQEI